MCRSDSPVSRSVVIDDRTAVLILFRPLKDLSAEQLVTGRVHNILTSRFSSRLSSRLVLSPAMHRRRLVINLFKINFIIIIIIIVKYCYLVECDQICDEIRPLVKIDMILEMKQYLACSCHTAHVQETYLHT